MQGPERHIATSINRLLVFVSLFIAITLTGLARAEALLVPGTTLAMEPPPGYSLSGGFSGFENLVTNSSITIMELPVTAYDQIAASMATTEAATKALASQGIEVTNRSSLTVGGEEVPFIEGLQPYQSSTIVKYFTILKGEKTVLVTFNIFDESVTTKEVAIDALETIELRSAPSLEDQLKLLPYSVSNKAPFEAKHVIGGSSVIMPTFEGDDPTGLKPLIILSSGQPGIATSQLQPAAESLFRTVRGLQGVTITSSRSLTLPGGKVFVVEGKTSVKSAIQYLWPTGTTGYVRMLAVGASEQLDPLRSTISDIADSVQPK